MREPTNEPKREPYRITLKVGDTLILRQSGIVLTIRGYDDYIYVEADDGDGMTFYGGKQEAGGG